jgi:hypothetical protein
MLDEAIDHGNVAKDLADRTVYYDRGTTSRSS